MRASHTKADWDAYVEQELASVRPHLEELGFDLDQNQVHIGGERYLMSGKKLVLTGTKRDTASHAIIKTSSDASGIAEIEAEHKARTILESLPFAERPFLFPNELIYGQFGPHRISATEFVDQFQPFTAHTLQEQFFLALRALAVQEGVHATTFEHSRLIREAFGIASTDTYLSEFSEFSETARRLDPDNMELRNAYADADEFLKKNRTTIERYSGFLTHEDFAPHNFRVNGRNIFLLDLPAFRFGNKYESWARFLNYMTIHNPELERMLVTYIHENRSSEEYLSLQLMRIFKLGQLLRYYVSTLSKTEGDLHLLNRERITFWTAVLRTILNEEPVSDELVQGYITQRNELRSDEERKRQEAIQQMG